MTSGPEDVERGVVADALLELDVHLDLVERNVAGPFDHDLDARFQGPLHQLPQGQELFDLGAVGGVDDGARPEPVAEAEGDVVPAGDVEKAVELVIKRVLLSVVKHPGQMEGPAAGDDVGHPALLLQSVDGLQGQAGNGRS